MAQKREMVFKQNVKKQEKTQRFGEQYSRADIY